MSKDRRARERKHQLCSGMIPYGTGGLYLSFMIGKGSEPSLGRWMETFVLLHGHIWYICIYIYICAMHSYSRETDNFMDSTGYGHLGRVFFFKYSRINHRYAGFRNGRQLGIKRLRLEDEERELDTYITYSCQRKVAGVLF